MSVKLQGPLTSNPPALTRAPTIAPNMIPAGQSQPGGSSSTLWAQASKEWVIPPRPKPGRKPKKLATPTPSEDAVGDDDDIGRKTQNRAAQRAFRERKQSQLADLQARLQEYEQGEVERNVHLQSIAKKLKEENDILKAENARLKAEIAQLVAASDIVQGEHHKRSHDEVYAFSGQQDPPTANTRRKRLKSQHLSGDAVPSLHSAYLPTPPADVPTPDSSSSISAFSPSAYSSPAASYPTPSPSSGPGAHGYPQPEIPSDQGDGLVLDSFDCLRSSDRARCDAGDEVADPSAMCATSLPFDHPAPESLPDIASSVADPLLASSLLDNLPPYQPPVPLPRRVTSAPTNRVFAYTTVQAPLCTGNPSSCPACADDPFGKAFCSALGDAVCDNPDCQSCPGKASTIRRSSPTPPAVESSSIHVDIQQPQPSKMIPNNCAWSQLKAHPNAQFADLRLLAEVVAGKQRCTGSRVLFSPPPPSAGTFRGTAHADASACYPPASQQPSWESARDRRKSPVLEVESANVREALALLDAGGLHRVG